MDLTRGTDKEKNERAKKMMLWFGIASLLMGFAGWTSAYIVSSSREDWLIGLQIPYYFYISAVVILFSSLTYILAKNAIRNDRAKECTTWLLVTMVLGVAFIFLQFRGFNEMLSYGYYFTGPTSSIKMSYVFLIAAVHIVHVVAGIISLSVVLFNQVNKKYTSGSYLGISLGATFWHFLDLLWVYLVLFMTLVK